MQGKGKIAMTTRKTNRLSALQRLARGLLLGTAAALSLAGAASAAGELNVFNWGEYINPEVLKAFEAETGIKVNLSTYSSNEEMLAKVQGGTTG